MERGAKEGSFFGELNETDIWKKAVRFCLKHAADGAWFPLVFEDGAAATSSALAAAPDAEF